MEATLLQRFSPCAVLDSKETSQPVDINQYADSCLVKDDAFDAELKGGIGQNLANQACYLEPPFKQPAGQIIVGGDEVGNTVASVPAVPMAGKADTLLFDGQYFYSLLYLVSFPASAEDLDVVHYIKVLVSCSAMKVMYAVFGIAGSSLPPAVVSRNQLQFSDRLQEHTMVYLSPFSHNPLPKPGKFWRSGRDAGTVDCDGLGAQWQPSSIRPLSNVLMQFKGRLAKHPSAKVPSEQAFWGATTIVDVDRVWQKYLSKA